MIAGHPVVAFLVMVYGINIALAAVPPLTRRDLLPFDQAPYDLLGHLFGVAVPAFVVTAAVGGREGVRDLMQRCLRWRIGLRWYAAALVGLPVAALLVAVLFDGTAALQQLGDKWPLLFTSMLPQLLFVIVFSNVFEEVGWTGFLFERTQARFSPLKASVIVAVPFALFHIPGYVVESASFAEVLLLTGVLFVPQFASRVIVAWFYNNTARSVLIVGMFHSSFNVTSGRFAEEFITTSGEEIFVLTSGLVILAAIALIVLKKRALRPVST